jgi:hypothetical protein
MYAGLKKYANLSRHGQNRGEIAPIAVKTVTRDESYPVSVVDLELCVLQLNSNYLELLIFRIPHYGIIHVFIHEITLQVYHEIITCWNVLK